MENKEEFIDDLYRKIPELELLLKKYLWLIDEIKIERSKQDELTIRGILFDNNRIKNTEKEIEKFVAKFIEFGTLDKQVFRNVIFAENVLSNYALEWIFKELSNKSRTWKSLIEELLEGIVDTIQNGAKSNFGMNHFYSLILDLPNQFFTRESAIIKKLVNELETENVSLLYAIKYFLWHQDYVYPEVIDGFNKNLEHGDWRIRLITHEYLKTWKERYKFEGLELSGLRFWDRIKGCFYRNYESKLIDGI